MMRNENFVSVSGGFLYCCGELRRFATATRDTLHLRADGIIADGISRYPVPIVWCPWCGTRIVYFTW